MHMSLDYVITDQVSKEEELPTLRFWQWETPTVVVGRFQSLKDEVGDTIQVGEVLVVLNGEGKKENKTEKEEEKRKLEKLEEKSGSEPESKVENKSGKTLATPSTRKLARERGVNIDLVEGTGQGGRVTKQDVNQFSQEDRKPKEKNKRSGSVKKHEKNLKSSNQGKDDYQFDKYGDVERKRINGIRKRIAENVSRSQREIPQATHFDEADVTDL